MGSLLSGVEPCTRLIPLISLRRLGVSVVGSGRPCSICMERTADR